MNDTAREQQWAAWMRAAIAGDMAAYRRFLEEATPYLRALARRHCVGFGAASSESEDIVQETLLAIHLKRGSWDANRPIMPWLITVARNKAIDALRRGGRRASVGLDEVIETLEAPEQYVAETSEIERMLSGLKERERDIVRAVSLQEQGMPETARRLGMTEGALRVALHRALKTLATRYRGGRK